jgi:hypothetical protein
MDWARVEIAERDGCRNTQRTNRKITDGNNRRKNDERRGGEDKVFKHTATEESTLDVWDLDHTREGNTYTHIPNRP